MLLIILTILFYLNFCIDILISSEHFACSHKRVENQICWYQLGLGLWVPLDEFWHEWILNSMSLGVADWMFWAGLTYRLWLQQYKPDQLYCRTRSWNNTVFHHRCRDIPPSVQVRAGSMQGRDGGSIATGCVGGFAVDEQKPQGVSVRRCWEHGRWKPELWDYLWRSWEPHRQSLLLSPCPLHRSRTSCALVTAEMWQHSLAALLCWCQQPVPPPN